MKPVARLAVAALLALSTQSVTAGDPAAGREMAASMCASCHSENGVSTVTQFPIIAGQYEDYLVQSLEDYRSGKRENPVMNGFASQLSDRDIANLAAWFASQPSPLFTPSAR